MTKKELVEALYQKHWVHTKEAPGINILLRKQGKYLRIYLNADDVIREILIEDDHENARIPVIENLEKLTSNICNWKSKPEKDKFTDFYNTHVYGV